MRFPKLSFIEWFGIVTAIIGITGVSFLRAPIIQLLGGYTQEDMDLVQFTTVKHTPYYKIRHFANISMLDCRKAVNAVIEVNNLPATPWESNVEERNKYGYNFEVRSPNGALAKGDIACYTKFVSGLSDDTVAYILTTMNTPSVKLINADSLIDDFVATLEASMPVDARKGFPTPFLPNLDTKGRFQIPKSYLGKEIVFVE